MFIRLIVFLGILGCSLRGFSQQNEHFIYLQSENKQPFYVKVGQGPLPLSSSKSGYLILPRVPEGQCSLSVGFPDSAYPEQHFVCPITSDKGYLLKRFPDKGWALYDLQELTLIYAGQAPKGKDSADQIQPASTHDSTLSQQSAAAQANPGQTTQGSGSGQIAAQASPTAGGLSAGPAAGAAVVATRTGETAGNGSAVGGSTVTGAGVAAGGDTTPKVADTTPQDTFGSLLSAATKDSTLKDIKAYKKPPPQPVETAPVTTAVVPVGAVAMAAKPGKGATAKTAAPKGAHPAKGAGIALLSKEETEAGVKLTFTDKQKAGKVDTVRILVPAPLDSTLAVQVRDSVRQSDSTVAVASVTAASANAVPAEASPGSATPGNAVSGAAVLPATVVAGNVNPPDTSGKTTASQVSVTPADTTQAFNPSSVQGSGHKDTGNLVVPIFKQSAGAQAPNSLASLAAGAGITESSGATTAKSAVPQTSSLPAPGDTSKAATLTAGFGVQSGAVPAQGTGVLPATGAGTDAGHLVNTDCKHLASDDDFLKVRKRMVAESDDDSMITAAKKIFKKTCFTTDQIRNLSSLFNQEDAKYKFLEEAYPFVSDAWNYKALQSLFTSNYYIGRFKALVEQR